MANSKHQIGFSQAVLRAMQGYSDFEGRSTRSEFWWYALFYVLVLALCAVFDFVELASNVSLGSVLTSIFAIVTLLPTLAVAVRRLRDSGDSWKNIFWLLLPFVGVFILAIYWVRPTTAKSAK